MILYNADIERAIIGAILIDPDTLPDIRAVLPIESFYGRFEREAYTSIAGMADKGAQIDFLTVADDLEKRHPGHDWLIQLAEIAKNTPSTANVLGYCDAVAHYAYLRKVYAAGEEICRTVLDGRDLSETVVAAQVAVGKVNQLDTGKGPVDAKTATRDLIQHLTNLHGSQGVPGLSTGFSQIDELSTGMKPGELHILAARPGVGKTVLALQVGLHNALVGKSVLIFSLEMQSRELFSRLASMQTGTYYRNLQTADLCADQWSSISVFAEKMSKAPLYVDDRACLRIDEIRSVSRSHKNRHGVDLVIIDYLQLATADGENDVVRVGAVSRGCKTLAKELNCPVLALSQFSRAVEQRQDGRPKLSDLRSSGQIEQDADVVMLMHRVDDSSTELIIEKNRHGQTGSVWLRPEFHRMRFVETSEPVLNRIDMQPKAKKWVEF